MASPLVSESDFSPALARTAGRARQYVEASRAENTRRAYRVDWSDFTLWCEGQRLQALPAAPDTVALYLTHLAEGCRVTTLQRRLASINQAHRTAGLPSPTQDEVVRIVMRGIRRVKGTAPRGKAPAVTAEVRRMVATLEGTLTGQRDRALLLLGFAGAFRRSELVSLDREDLEITLEGITVTLRRSKTDQEGQGRKVGIPYGSFPATCPVRSLLSWLEAARIVSGPLFRPVNRHGQLRPNRLTAQSVALIVKRAAAAAGLDPARYAGHSLRAGLATSAAAAGVSERAIMQQTGHRSVVMVRRYIRDGRLFQDNAAAAVGL